MSSCSKKTASGFRCFITVLSLCLPLAKGDVVLYKRGRKNMWYVLNQALELIICTSFFFFLHDTIQAPKQSSPKFSKSANIYGVGSQSFTFQMIIIQHCSLVFLCHVYMVTLDYKRNFPPKAAICVQFETKSQHWLNLSLTKVWCLNWTKLNTKSQCHRSSLC